MDLPVSCKLVFLIMLIIMLPISATVQSQRKVALGSVLIAGEPNSSWESPSGDFAFGFRQVSPAGYLLSIVFLKTPSRTIAWSANGGNIALTGSKLQLSADGLKLVLSGPNRQQIWVANFSGSGVAYGAMLDTGNFLLARNDSTVLWQTFDEPTDTLLPGQVLNQNGALFSSLSETNYSRGRFKFIMQTDSNLVLYPVDYPSTDIGRQAYWASNTVNAEKYRTIFNESGYLSVVAENGTTIHYVFSKAVSASEFYQRLTLDPDGVLRRYVYRKSTDSTDNVWSVHDLIPSDICTALGEDKGVGVCGYNSVCNLGPGQKPYCICPKGYFWLDPTDKTSGCTPNFTKQSCNQRSAGGFQLVELNNIEWQALQNKHFQLVSEDWCSQSCLDDCYCDAAFFREGECWMNSIPLMFGRVDYGRGGKTLLKIA